MSRLNELIAEWEAEVEAQTVVFMERDGMAPSKAASCAEYVVTSRRKLDAEDRKQNSAPAGSDAALGV